MSTVSLPTVHPAQFKPDFGTAREWLKQHWREHVMVRIAF